MIRLGDLASSIGGALSPSDALTRGVQVNDVEHDSRLVKPGTLFACIPGQRSDGHDFAAVAVQAGACALLAQRRVSAGAPVLRTDSVRRALGPAAAAVHGCPSERLDLVGVTGTNGKTTTVRLIAWVLSWAGASVAEIGTLTGARTTPEAPELQRQIAAAVRRGDRAVVMEVSSHALAQHRVDGCRFRAAVFTNLGHDHLDYHGSSERYWRAKARLFKPALTDRAIVNVGGHAGRRLADTVDAGISVTEVDERSVEIVSLGVQESRFRWRGELVRLPLGGAFNITNAVMAAEAALALGVRTRSIARALESVPQVPGRFEVIDEGQEFTVIVDYAHTPEALASVLEAARCAARGRLAVVFGAGGDRDALKRPAMGAAAEASADQVVLTNDNPRWEDPRQITEQILAGMSRPPDLVEPDRRLAIRHAVSEARAGDVVVIAGKGHECVQVAGGFTHAFDDRAVAREELARRARRMASQGLSR